MKTEPVKKAVDDTLRHLESLKSSGITHVKISPQTLAALSKPVPRRTPPVARPPSPVGVPSADPKTLLLAKLRTRALVCVQCQELAQTRKQVVFGVGNPNAELMFIGEAPGADEDEKGEPFVGRAGQLLTKIITAMNLTREEVYIANVLKCRPPENRKPTPDEEEKCLPYLIEQVKILQPKAIVALGAVAVQALLKLDIGISKMRGNWYEFQGIPLMPTFHPSYLLRNQSLEIKRLVWEDMLQVMKKLGHPITPKQQAFFKTNAP